MTGSKCCLLKYKSKYTLYLKGLGDWKEIRISFYNSICSYTHKVPNNNSMIIVYHSQYVCAIWAQNSLSYRSHERHMCLNPTTLKYVMHIGECVEVSALKGVLIRLHMTTFTYKYSIRFIKHTPLLSEFRIAVIHLDFSFLFAKCIMMVENDTQFTMHLVRLVPPTGRTEYCKRVQWINDCGHSFQSQIIL